MASCEVATPAYPNKNIGLVTSFTEKHFRGVDCYKNEKIVLQEMTFKGLTKHNELLNEPN